MSEPLPGPDDALRAQYLAERDEILRHKWLESEKAGRDIGFEQALVDWVRNHRATWRAAQARQGD